MTILGNLKINNVKFWPFLDIQMAICPEGQMIIYVDTLGCHNMNQYQSRILKVIFQYTSVSSCQRWRLNLKKSQICPIWG